MRSFSTCASCNEILQVTWVGQLTHPTCQQTDEELKLRAFVDAAQRGDEAAANRLEQELNKPVAPVSMGSAALWYASIGWPVFPLVSWNEALSLAKRRNIAPEKIAKTPATPHGFKDASTDPDRVREWWGANPNYGIGLATGHIFDVIDIDGKKGYETLRSRGDEIYGIVNEIGGIHGKVATIREDSGEHWYIKATGDNSKNGFLPGMDLKAKGGYVCAPPTLIGKRRYSWTTKPSPEIAKSR